MTEHEHDFGFTVNFIESRTIQKYNIPTLVFAPYI